jgi:hypothetical protein
VIDALKSAMHATEKRHRAHDDYRAAVVARVGSPRPTVKSVDESRAESRLEYAISDEKGAWERVGRSIPLNDAALAALKKWAGLE